MAGGTLLGAARHTDIGLRSPELARTVLEMTITRLPAPPTDDAIDAWHAVVSAAHTHDRRPGCRRRAG